MTTLTNEKTRHHIVLMYCLDELVREVRARAPELCRTSAYIEARQALGLIRRHQARRRTAKRSGKERKKYIP